MQNILNAVSVAFRFFDVRVQVNPSVKSYQVACYVTCEPTRVVVARIWFWQKSQKLSERLKLDPKKYIIEWA